MKRLEIDTMKAFTDAMEAIFYEGIFHDSFLYLLVRLIVYWEIIKM